MKISELNHKISQIKNGHFQLLKVTGWKNAFTSKKIKDIEFDLSLILHSQLINEFVGEYKGLKSKFDEKMNKSIIEIDQENHIKFGKEVIGKSEGFRFRIYHSFKNNNIYNNKILKKQLLFLPNKRQMNSKFKIF